MNIKTQYRLQETVLVDDTSEYRILYRYVYPGDPCDVKYPTPWEVLILEKDGYSFAKFDTKQEALDELFIRKLAE